ncbi:integrase domain-containing protein [Paraburkholderia diazotrophica]|uniref:integrase domain-containing protein n=1 Tax=Paraburkholderia diazotrophica TaxID=667676 RepID=UPI00317D5A8D
MGQTSRLRHGSREYSRYRGGSFKTQDNRRQLTHELWTFPTRLGIRVAHIRDIPLWMIALYFQMRLCEGIAAPHARNTTTAVRVLLDEAGRGRVNTECSNDALGVPRRDRTGTRRALTPEEFAQMRERARCVDEGLAHHISIMYYLGPRAIEALRSADTLAGWLALLRMDANSLPFSHGAKTNRFRNIEIISSLRDQTIQTIEEALAYCETHNGRLLNGIGNDLKTGRNRMRTALQAAGFSGDTVSHCCRYSYAVNLALELLDAGVSPDDVLDRVSQSLGHGDRAPMVLNTYLREIKERFASATIPRVTSRNPKRAGRRRHLPGPQRTIRSNRVMQFKKES